MLDFRTSMLLLLYLNLFILILFVVYTATRKRKKWYLKSYAIGKLILIAATLILLQVKYLPANLTIGGGFLLLLISYAFEVFSIISFDGKFRKSIFYAILAISLIALILLSYSTNGGHFQTIVAISYSVLLFGFGGIILLKNNNKLIFKNTIAVSYIMFSILQLIRLIYTTHNNLYDDFSKNTIVLPNLFFVFAFLTVIVGSVGFLLIINELNEHQLLEKHKATVKDNITLKETDTAKSKFFSIIAHDLRGPIGSLASFSELLVNRKEELEPEDYEEWLEMVFKTTTRTYTLLNNLLQWSKAETGQIVSNPTRTNINEICESVLKLMAVITCSKQILINVAVNKPVYVWADSEMISTVIRNLISNSLKFTHKGGNINLSCIEKDDYIEFRISDNGIGIPKDKQQSIFKIGEYVTIDGTDNEKGSGLGLLLCKGLIEKNKGKIWFESEVGKGTTFFFTLPRYTNQG